MAKIRISNENPAGRRDGGLFYAYDEFHRLLATGANEEEARRGGEKAAADLHATEGRQEPKPVAELATRAYVDAAVNAAVAKTQSARTGA